MDTYTITFTNGSTTTFTVTNGSDASVIVDTALSSSSTNPVQNKVINTALNGKASSNHSHSISDVSNLQTTLDGKANSSHTHTVSNITDFPTIVDNLNSTSSTSVLSARQGKVLNDLIGDAITYINQ